MGKFKLYIRVDGSSDIGLGHIYRCVALGQMLQDDFEVSFWSVEIPDKVRTSIKKNFGYEFKYLSKEKDFFELLKQDQNKPVTVVLDGYHFDTRYQSDLKALEIALVCIDDIHDKHFIADVVINHGPGISKSDYSVEPSTDLYLGPDYALLRNEFIKLATEEKSPVEKIETAFVCFGGADLLNFTEKTLGALIHWKSVKKINVVTGGGFQRPESIDKIQNYSSIISHYHNIGDQQMASLMKKSDFAIVPSSTILYEVIAARLPAITGYYMDNQFKLNKGFSNTGAATGVGKFSKGSIEKALQELTLIQCQQIQKNQRKIIDGHSPQRIRRIFQDII